MKKIIVGIDEVGRGPIAGPVSVGIVLCRSHFSVLGIGDSKAMSPASRERLYEIARGMQSGGEIRFGVFSVSAARVDATGIERAIASAIARGLASLAPDPDLVEVLLDGRLRAPREYRQQTLIHGDALVPAISLAAIVAKVERDRHMSERVHRRYPAYGFDAHKGYGTVEHFAALKTHGLTPIHRRSFLRNIVLASAHE